MDDCRRSVMLSSASPRTWFKRFTCDLPENGRKTCHHTELENGVCVADYWYTRQVTPTKQTPARP